MHVMTQQRWDDSPCVVLLDRELRILAAEPRLQTILRMMGIEAGHGARLPWLIESALRSLPSFDEAICEPVTGFICRTTVLEGAHGGSIALSIDRARWRSPIDMATERFRLTRREREVLCLILRGLEAKEIANSLSIAESTVCEFFKHLANKIPARNRSHMVAKVLNWQDAY